MAALVPDRVVLTWTKSTDNTGVTGYRVNRSATSGFTPVAATKIADVTAASYPDTGLAAGSWYYRVIAIDAAGNASAGSVQARAVIAGGQQTVSPVQDSYAVQASPATNYGTTASMASRGGTSSYAAYLKFSLPAAPAGTTLVGARLSVTTTSDSFAGSADAHLVSLSTNGWTESGLTWKNRPAVGSKLGTITGASKPSTSYSSVLTPAAFVAAGSGQLTVSVTSASSDNLWFLSRNSAASSKRPTLVLTYQPTG
jgi:large repetitive protein